jgi:hypothetical protein
LSNTVIDKATAKPAKTSGARLSNRKEKRPLRIVIHVSLITIISTAH